VFVYFMFLRILSWLTVVVISSAIDCLERLVAEMICYVSNGTLKPTHSFMLPRKRSRL